MQLTLLGSFSSSNREGIEMAAHKIDFDFSRIRISEEEILADLSYPARPRHSRNRIRALESRAARRGRR
jgi:hypothetical protein